jgi:hypothetical protein
LRIEVAKYKKEEEEEEEEAHFRNFFWFSNEKPFITSQNISIT